MVEKEKNEAKKNQLVLTDRREMVIDGAVSLGHYDEKEAAIQTGAGRLVVRGENLNVKEMNLEENHLVIEGSLKSLQYDEPVKGKHGFLQHFIRR